MQSNFWAGSKHFGTLKGQGISLYCELALIASSSRQSSAIWITLKIADGPKAYTP